MLPARYISRLRLSNFRNYTHAALDLDARHLVLVGPNGAGKTNLLEAVSLLAPGRGLRRAAFESLSTSNSNEPWAVAATIETPGGPADVGTGMAEDGGRRVRLNGANARSVEQVSEYMRVLWLTPSMDGLFTGPAADRRRFLDRLVTTLVPTHSRTVGEYEDAMRQRNRLLADNADPLWINALETQMAALAAAVHFGRLDTLDRLRASLDESRNDEDFPAAELLLTPLFDRAAEPSTSADLEAELVSVWRQSRQLDRASSRTQVGPHRVDLEVVHAQKQVSAGLASTGEQKALLVGLVLAHARLVKSVSGIVPFLLLDEIAAHFDPARRRALFAALDVLETQCMMTGTDLALFEALGGRAQRILVRGGRFTEQPQDMPSETYELFREAMAERSQIVCTYDGLERQLCPIILGHSDGEEKALVFQFGGGTSNGPVRPPGEWKCLRLAAVRHVALREGEWLAGGRHSAAQSCVKDVDFDVNPESPYNPRRQL